MSLRRWWRRTKYLRAERQLLAARETMAELKAFVGPEVTPPAYLQTFMYTVAKEIGETESFLARLRKEGI